MPARALLIEARLVDGRYHGDGDWPPSPFRMFQALVAGAYGGRWRAEPEAPKDAAFRWLEALDPPHIAAPPKRQGRVTTYFVPNNDLDSVGGDPRRVSEIRARKEVKPVLFEAGSPFLYVWPFDEGEAEAQTVCTLAERLHTLGLGIDAAYARADVIDWAEAEARLLAYGGTVARPLAGIGGPDDPTCPVRGSLDSLKLRHAGFGRRFEIRPEGKRTVTLFRQPPKAVFTTVAYDRPSIRLLFDLRRSDAPAAFYAIAQERAAEVATAVRDLAAKRLIAAFPHCAAEIERIVVGRGAEAADLPCRIRVVPLPSIGFVHTDPAIRRVMVEIPPDCPVPARDLAWSVSGQSVPGFERTDQETGEVKGAVLAPAGATRFLKHYGATGTPHQCWRTITPAALPKCRLQGQVSGSERAADERRAAVSVAAALRHAGLDPRGAQIRVQVEPFRTKGARADAFHSDRFDRRSLRHVEVIFPRPVSGPIVLGNGRWLGLGVMAPAAMPSPDLHLFAITHQARPPAAQAETVARALRRAVMACAAAQMPRGMRLPSFFSGHTDDGQPHRPGRHEHLFFLAQDMDGDGRLDRVAVIAPHLGDRTVEPARGDLDRLDAALAGLVTLRAGPAGVLRLLPLDAPSSSDLVFGTGRLWISQTPYHLTRHPKRRDGLQEAAQSDIVRECIRRGFPKPRVDIVESTPGSRQGLAVRARLRFDVAVQGPLLLGLGSHFGLGLFRAEE